VEVTVSTVQGRDRLKSALIGWDHGCQRQATMGA